VGEWKEERGEEEKEEGAHGGKRIHGS
jgi:hypothetical protein